LRDVTLTEIATNIPEEIKSVWPEILGTNFFAPSGMQ
jgi:hypothetical protein